MPHIFLRPDDAATESQLQDIPEERWSSSQQHRLFPRFLGYTHSRPMDFVSVSGDSSWQSAGVPEESSWAWRRQRLYPNLRAFFSRLLALAYDPKSFGPVIIDCLLLVQSTWSGRQLGPDLVYPMMGIRKRQSERLARLILDHSRDQQSYELRTRRTFPPGIDPPCVAVIDLDQVPHSVVENGYSTHSDLYGLACLLMLVETISTLVLSTWVGVNKLNTWEAGIVGNLALFCYSVCRGDGTLTLARRPDASTFGCAVLLDQSFTVILNGDQSVVEAIAESNFNLSYSSGLLLPAKEEDRGYQDSPYDWLGALCEGTGLGGLLLCWLIFSSHTPEIDGRQSFYALLASVFFISFLQRGRRFRFTFYRVWPIIKLFGYRSLPIVFIYLAAIKGIYTDTLNGTVALNWNLAKFWLQLFLIGFLSDKSKAENYPIRCAKFLDAIGHPQIRKWQFDTLAAATTFQCLVLCHGIARPIKSVDVLAFLEMLVPDEREVWKVWKKRVADRIVHEEDISFTPTIPMFRSESEQDMLVELLAGAKEGYDTYRRFFGPDAAPLDFWAADDVCPTYFSRIWSMIGGFFSPV